MCADGISSFIRLNERSTVLLPQPDEPISAVIFCRSTFRLEVLDGPESAVEHVQT